MDTRLRINHNHYKTNPTPHSHTHARDTAMDACTQVPPSDATGYCWFTAVILTLTHGEYKIPDKIETLQREGRHGLSADTIAWLKRPFADGGYSLRFRHAEHMVKRVPKQVKGCFALLYENAQLTTNKTTKAQQTWDNLLRTGAYPDEITLAIIAMTLPAMSVTLFNTTAAQRHKDNKLNTSDINLFGEATLQIVENIEDTKPKTLYIQSVAVKQHDFVRFQPDEIKQERIYPFHLYQDPNGHKTWAAVNPNLANYLDQLKEHVTQNDMQLLGILVMFHEHTTCALHCEDHWVLQNAYCPPVNLSDAEQGSQTQQLQQQCHDALHAILKPYTYIDLFQIIAIKQ